MSTINLSYQENGATLSSPDFTTEAVPARKVTDLPFSKVGAKARIASVLDKHGLVGDYRDVTRYSVASGYPFYGDEVTAEMAECENLLSVPVDVMITKVQKDKVSGVEVVKAWKSLPTAENIQWVFERIGAMPARNMMSAKIELLSLDGCNSGVSEVSATSQLLSECARRGVPDKNYAAHMESIAERNAFHPINETLKFRQWDGKNRVADVLGAIKTDDDPYSHQILLKWLAGAICAIDSGSVAIKFCPVIHSKANNWYKSQLPERLFNLVEGAFGGAIGIPDPSNKDDLMKSISAWCYEFGELAGMTKRDAEAIKSFIPMSEDIFRLPYGRCNLSKPRQTVYIGTTNRDDFIHDETIATRFPVIKLTSPIDIERINKALGYEFDGNRAVLTDREQLIQFWLEVRQMVADGLNYVIDGELLAITRGKNKEFESRTSYDTTLLDTLAMHDGRTYQTTTQICNEIGVPVDKRVHVGRALNKLSDNGVIEKKVTGGVAYYTFPTRVNYLPTRNPE
ncbi:hypothetical protein H0O97_22210 [Escherichia coli]|uniref:VapE domain-containing protein n=1 Tax=Escherichia coli TaxID=562 RepID=UPI0015D8AD5E|nr:VapE domain-containing protein [Escherichia coli]NZC06414.1 hypothetical protein [Escherichia coli]